MARLTELRKLARLMKWQIRMLRSTHTHEGVHTSGSHRRTLLHGWNAKRKQGRRRSIELGLSVKAAAAAVQSSHAPWGRAPGGHVGHASRVWRRRGLRPPSALRTHQTRRKQPQCTIQRMRRHDGSAQIGGRTQGKHAHALSALRKESGGRHRRRVSDGARVGPKALPKRHTRDCAGRAPASDAMADCAARRRRHSTACSTSKQTPKLSTGKRAARRKSRATKDGKIVQLGAKL
eukprot:6178462-Pleurochrysis_carterae.AAC.2